MSPATEFPLIIESPTITYGTKFALIVKRPKRITEVFAFRRHHKYKMAWVKASPRKRRFVNATDKPRMIADKNRHMNK